MTLHADDKEKNVIIFSGTINEANKKIGAVRRQICQNRV